MRGVTCPNCQTDTHVSKYAKDGFYVCATCGRPIGYLCKGCDRVYLENKLALSQDAYICKECGTTQWGYTEWKKSN